MKKLHEIIIKKVTDKLMIDERTRKWCTLPYPGHINGCPNYGVKDHCPPKAPMIGEFIDLEKDHWFIICKFNIDKHEKNMKNKHPEWSVKMCRNIYYWQNTVRKILNIECKKFIKNRNMVFTLLPEAMGINVMRTARRFKIPIRNYPKGDVYKIALIGFDKNKPDNPLDNFF